MRVTAAAIVALATNQMRWRFAGSSREMAARTCTKPIRLFPLAELLLQEPAQNRSSCSSDAAGTSTKLAMCCSNLNASAQPEPYSRQVHPTPKHVPEYLTYPYTGASEAAAASASDRQSPHPRHAALCSTAPDGGQGLGAV